MNNAEYAELQAKVNDSGLTQQAYIISAVKYATVISSDEIAVLKDISKSFADLEKQLRGLATNVNQMAHVANGYGVLPTGKELEHLSAQLGDYR